MNLLPFRRPPPPAAPAEDRQQGPYTDALTAAILAARGDVAAEADAGATAAVEMAAGVVSRAFAAAEIRGTELAGPEVLASIGRDLVTRGQSLWIVDAGDLYPAQTMDVSGQHPRRTWRYSVELAGPGGSTMRMTALPWTRVLHARYSFDPVTPG